MIKAPAMSVEKKAMNQGFNKIASLLSPLDVARCMKVMLLALKRDYYIIDKKFGYRFDRLTDDGDRNRNGTCH